MSTPQAKACAEVCAERGHASLKDDPDPTARARLMTVTETGRDTAGNPQQRTGGKTRNDYTDPTARAQLMTET